MVHSNGKLGFMVERSMLKHIWSHCAVRCFFQHCWFLLAKVSTVLKYLGSWIEGGGFCVVHTCIQWANKCNLLAGLSQGFKPYDLVYVKRIAFYMLDRKMGGCACKNAVPFSHHQSLEMYKIWKQLGNGLKGESDAKSLPFYWYFFCYIAMYCIVLQCNECIVTLFLFLWMSISQAGQKGLNPLSRKEQISDFFLKNQNY